MDQFKVVCMVRVRSVCQMTYYQVPRITLQTERWSCNRQMELKLL